MIVKSQRQIWHHTFVLQSWCDNRQGTNSKVHESGGAGEGREAFQVEQGKASAGLAGRIRQPNRESQNGHRYPEVFKRPEDLRKAPKP